MFKLKSTLLLVALAGFAATAHAKERGQPLTDCVELSPDHQLARFGSQYLMVKDGDEHYRIGFGGSGCSAITLTSNVEIVTAGKENQLCPAASKVKTRRNSCDAREVLRIDEVEYEKYARRQR